MPVGSPGGAVYDGVINAQVNLERYSKHVKGRVRRILKDLEGSWRTKAGRGGPGAVKP